MVCPTTEVKYENRWRIFLTFLLLLLAFVLLGMFISESTHLRGEITILERQNETMQRQSAIKIQELQNQIIVLEQELNDSREEVVYWKEQTRLIEGNAQAT